MANYEFIEGNVFCFYSRQSWIYRLGNIIYVYFTSIKLTNIKGILVFYFISSSGNVIHIAFKLLMSLFFLLILNYLLLRAVSSLTPISPLTRYNEKIRVWKRGSFFRAKRKKKSGRKWFDKRRGKSILFFSAICVKAENQCEERSSSSIWFAFSSVRLPLTSFRNVQVSSFSFKSLISARSSLEFRFLLASDSSS